MSPPVRGNPFLQVRLEPEMLEKLKEAAGEGAGGRMGGMSMWVRRLIHRELREPLAGGEIGDLLVLAEMAEQKYTWDDPAKAFDMFRTLKGIVERETDVIRRNFAAQLLGLATATMEARGMLALSEPPQAR